MKRAAVILALLPCFILSSAYGYERTDLVWRLFVTTMDPESGGEQSSSVQPGSQLDVSKDFRVGIAASYFIWDRVAVAAHTAWPFRNNLYLESDTQRSRLGAMKIMPLTLTLQYYLPKVGRAKPWIGAGVHYARFKDGRVSNGFADDISQVSFGSSNGVAGELGFDWDLGRHTSLTASAIRTRGDTDVLLIRDGVVADRFNADFNALVWGVGLSRRF